tara:strand:- start:1362 stop:1550 length:189 start_codon:yes stop_codon:yes gene_type:complete
MLCTDVVALGTPNREDTRSELVLLDQTALLPHLECRPCASALLVTIVVLTLALGSRSGDGRA